MSHPPPVTPEYTAKIEEAIGAAYEAAVLLCGKPVVCTSCRMKVIKEINPGIGKRGEAQQ